MAPTRQQQLDALTNAISRVLIPVMLCMALSLWFVHGFGDPNLCENLVERKIPEITLEDDNRGGTLTNSAEYPTIWAIVFVAVFLVLMVAVTFLIVWLYKTGKHKIIKAWIMIAVFLIFAYVGGLYIFDFCRSRCINLDWITLSFAVWNFTITGLFAIFDVVPRIINQSYLIIMSALMAYVFRTLPSWSLWIILSALVIWDLFAVLSKYGPLQILVKIAKERDEPLPALVYDTNPDDPGREDVASPSTVAPPKERRRPNENSDSTQNRRKTHRSKPEQQQTLEVVTDSNPIDNLNEEQNENQGRERTSFFSRKRRAPNTADNSNTANASSNNATQGEDKMKIGTLGTHLKLGLGDFVFYSILVAQASKSGAMTAITSFIAILAGLCATLFLVTVYRKALPALPISITAGLLFYVVTRFTVQPFINNLYPELLFH